MRTHTLKTWPVYFEQIMIGNKTFEVRKNDRDFMAWDILELVEYDPVKNELTGRVHSVRVTYILFGAQFGIEPGHVVMSIR
jgi:hypothetical protein